LTRNIHADGSEQPSKEQSLQKSPDNTNAATKIRQRHRWTRKLIQQHQPARMTNKENPKVANKHSKSKETKQRADPSKTQPIAPPVTKTRLAAQVPTSMPAVNAQDPK